MKMAKTPKVFTEIRDTESDSVPSIDEMRASQKKGNEGEGLNETDCRDLNAAQGLKVDIRE